MLKRPRTIPSSPGVYFFRGLQGKILYIGKAGNLKNRLRSYFQKRLPDPRLAKMLEKATVVNWQETSSEIEALILESQLIKKNRPPFNILLRDDKQYFYVVITKELFPKILITHQPHFKFQHSDISSTIGPFTEGASLRTTLKLFRGIFPYCTCRQAHYRRCLNAHLGKCPGYCCLRQTESGIMNQESREYKKNIKSITDILSGKKTSLVKKLEQEMEKDAVKEDFQKSIELRDKIAKVNQVFANARVIKEIAERDDALALLQKTFNLPAWPQRIEGYDIANIQGQFATGSMVVFTNGNQDKSEYRKFRIRSGNTPDDTGMLQEVLRRRFNHTEWPHPDLILIDGGKGQLNAAKKEISRETTIIALTKNDKHKGDHVFLSNKKEPIALKNLPPPVSDLILQIDDEAHRFAIEYYRKLHRKAIS